MVRGGCRLIQALGIMSSSIANADIYLSRAITFLMLVFLGFTLLGFAAGNYGISLNDTYVLICMMALNLVPTWYIWQSAKLLGKNRWMYGGLAILGIPFAIMSLSILKISRDFPLLLKIFGRSKK
ncbi:hypothetical protein GCM10027077_20480 [Arenimonas maotaiensis]